LISVRIAAREVPEETWAFAASFRKLHALGPFAGPVTATVVEESTGISRSGMIAPCVAQGTGLVCK
jgi:hypothetical protein